MYTCQKVHPYFLNSYIFYPIISSFSQHCAIIFHPLRDYAFSSTTEHFLIVRSMEIKAEPDKGVFYQSLFLLGRTCRLGEVLQTHAIP